MTHLRDKRFVLSLLWVGVLGAAFWGGSRYPALNEKAAVGGNLHLSDPLSFEPVFAIEPDAPFAAKVMLTTLNWANTNRQGMTFGLLLAAGFMTLFSRLRTVRFESALSNTLLGVALGAPLGVCVNCAAPIARGLHAAGARVETSLAAMISSPTLNIVVLTMLFSLFPFYLAAIKLGLTLLFLVVGIPLLVRWVGAPAAPPEVDRLASRTSSHFSWAADMEAPLALGWGSAAGWLVREYGRHLWFIVKYTVPLMFVAGLIGAVAGTLFPWGSLADALPRFGEGQILTAMGVVALVGLLLPLPIAFDVVVAGALLAGGLPVKYVALLLFTLGVFSVYSFFVVWEAISFRLAASVAAALLVLGMAAGVGAHFYRKWDAPRQSRLVHRTLLEAPARAARPAPERGAEPGALIASLADERVRWRPAPIAAPPGITLERVALAPRAPAPGRTLFSRHYGEQLGIERVDQLPVAYKFTPPFYRDWPVAAGDVHGDGWIDVVLGSDRGVHLFANQGGRRFVRQALEVPGLDDLYAANLALTDLDGDGWLDLFVSAYRQGNHVVYNEGGRFRRLVALPGDANLANAAAFGDLDGDGDLEIVLGNWSVGIWMRRPPAESTNAILWNEGGAFRAEPLPGVPGETLSTLLSDVDVDGDLDLLVGNDFSPPDFFYLGEGEGGFRLLTREDGVIPHSTTTTMSIDSADVDNDLRPEIYVGQITGFTPSQQRRLPQRTTGDVCAELEDPSWRGRCQRRLAAQARVRESVVTSDAYRCLAIDDEEARDDCVAYQMLFQATRGSERDASVCRRFPARWEPLAFICDTAFGEAGAVDEADYERAIPQILDRNVLLRPTGDGTFEDAAEEMGLDLGGWTWNAKFADLDNDEWQDLYVVNGAYRLRRRESNLFFRNLEGRGFEEASAWAGLEGFLATGSYVYVDLENDGDLDIVEASFDGPVWVHRNGSTSGHALTLELRDERGNSHGVGALVSIAYGPEGGRRQMRELKAGGGFLSFDPAVLHFGLGDHASIARLEVRWPDGERSVLQGPIAAGHRYRIRRHASP